MASPEEVNAFAAVARAVAQAAQEAQPQPLILWGVGDRNVPNQECVWLKANENANLAEYLLLVGLRLPNQNTLLPFQDHLFWLGDHRVDAGTWVIVYTGAGQERVSRDDRTGAPILSLHWGRERTIFTFNDIVPGLVRVVKGNLQIGQPGK